MLKSNFTGETMIFKMIKDFMLQALQKQRKIQMGV